MILVTILIGIVMIPIMLLLMVGSVAAFIGLIVGFFMLIFALVAKGFIVPWFDNRDRTRLDQDHKLIIPDKQVVRIDNYNGCYYVDCYHTDPESGREFIFTSQPFMQDPTALVNGVRLGVFVNSVDYSNYYVDTSKLGLSEKDGLDDKLP